MFIDQQKECVYECPDGLFGNDDGRDCADTCPTTPFYYYMDYQINGCISGKNYLI